MSQKKLDRLRNPPNEEIGGARHSDLSPIEYYTVIGKRTRKILPEKAQVEIRAFLNRTYSDAVPHYSQDELHKILSKYGISLDEYKVVWYGTKTETMEYRYGKSYTRITFSMHQNISKKIKKTTTFGKIKKRFRRHQ